MINLAAAVNLQGRYPGADLVLRDRVDGADVEDQRFLRRVDPNRHPFRSRSKSHRPFRRHSAFADEAAEVVGDDSRGPAAAVGADVAVDDHRPAGPRDADECRAVPADGPCVDPDPVEDPAPAAVSFRGEAALPVVAAAVLFRS